MAVTQAQIDDAVRIARQYGATRVVLSGSAVYRPSEARDLDLAVDGVEGWEFFRLGAHLDRMLGIGIDLMALRPPTPASRLVEKWGRVLYEEARHDA